LERHVKAFLARGSNGVAKPPDDPVLRRWFKLRTRRRLAFMFSLAADYSPKYQRFFQVAISHTLKRLALWLERATKPHFDEDKDVPDPLVYLEQHLRQMQRGNLELYAHLRASKLKKQRISISVRDALKPTQPGSIDLIVTSPPYANSYQYLLLHELSLRWLSLHNDEARRSFVGDAIFSDLAEDLEVDCFILKNRRDLLRFRKYRNYFMALHKAYKNMAASLRPGGTIVVVVGDSEFKRKPVPNASFTAWSLAKHGVEIRSVVRRHTLHSRLPKIRNSNGQFCSPTSKNKRLIHAHEYIITGARK
jgi:hypothetical protein